MNLAQGLADGAFVRLGAAFAMFGEAMGENDGSVDGADGVECRDLARVPGEAVAAVGALFGAEESGFIEFLQNFGQEREWDVVGCGNFLRTGDAMGGVDGEVLEGDESVVGFFGKFEHGKLC